MVWVVAALFVLKLLIMMFFPVVGDEAYYFYWGANLAGGYYDLSPMIGWWEAFFLKFSHSRFWLRIPNLFSVGMVTYVMYEWILQTLKTLKTLRGAGGAEDPTAGVAAKTKARAISSLFFFSPLFFLAVMISPDVPLVFFTFLSAFLFYEAGRSEAPRAAGVRYFFSGVLWGGAFLSKYFALFILPAYLIVFILFQRRSFFSRFFLGLLFCAGALPFLFQHFYWNWSHCWANFVFNLVTRQQSNDGPRWFTFGMFVIYLLIQTTPLLWKDLILFVRRKQDQLIQVDEVTVLKKALLLFWAIPIVIFGITALAKKGQGLHWYLSYTPFFFMWVGLSLRDQTLQVRVRQMMKLSGSLAVLVVIMLAAPSFFLGNYFSNHHPLNFQIAFHGKEWIKKIEPRLGDAAVVMTDGYTLSSVLAYELKRAGVQLPVNVWGDGSRFGRVFDWTSDYRGWDRKNVVIVSEGLLDQNRWSKYFKTWSPERFELNGREFFVTRGSEFKSSKYFEEIIFTAISLYYPPLFPGVCRIRDY